MQTSTATDFPILLIVGPGRSGTNFVARIFEQDDRFVNLYENRYIWNYRQRSRAVDHRDPKEADRKTVAYIRGHYAKLAQESGRILVDKTPGNALRLPFVRAVLPQARIINVLRDGRANVVSRGDLWDTTSSTGERGRRYFQQFQRMRRRGNLPAHRLIAFGTDNAAQILRSIIGGTPNLEGERVAGLGNSARAHGLAIARAIQWRETIMHAVSDGRRMESERYCEVRIEEFGTHPEEVCQRLFNFAGVEPHPATLAHVAESYDSTRAQRWQECGEPRLLEQLEPVLRPTLEYLGYKWELNTRPPIQEKAGQQ